MAVATDKILRLLKAGVAPDVIAQSIGVDTMDIFKIAGLNQAEIADAAAERLQTAVSTDELVSNTERLALMRLGTIIAAETDAKKLVSAYSALNKATRRQPNKEEGGVSQSHTTNVTIVLPSSVVERRMKEVQYVTDGNNQVVEVDGRAMITMDAKNVLNQARQTNAGVDRMLSERNIDAGIQLKDL